MHLYNYAVARQRRITTVPDDHLWTYLILYILSAILCMLFSLCYRAVLSGVESKLRRDADDGSKRSAELLSAMESSDKIERDALFAIFLFNAAACIFFEAALYSPAISLSPVFDAPAMKIVASVVLLILAELVLYIAAGIIPKAVAEHDPAAAYAVSAWISRPVFIIFRPFSVLSSVLGKLILKLLGIKSDGGENVTEDEILDLIDAGEESGTIEAAEKEMLENVFEFSEVTAYDVMTHRTNMESLDITDSDTEVLRAIEESGFSRFPVYEDDIDHIIGILYAREFLLDRMSGGKKSLRELIHQPLVTPEKVRADVLFREMQKSKLHLAIVLDEYGGTSGLVTMEDLLEEIFGNIYDEFDEHEPLDIQKLGENLWRVAGSIDLETLSDTIGWKLDDDVSEDYDTLGGLVFSSLALIPDEGELPHVRAFGLDIQVEVFADRRVEWATVSVVDDDDEDTEKNEEE